MSYILKSVLRKLFQEHHLKHWDWHPAVDLSVHLDTRFQ